MHDLVRSLGVGVLGWVVAACSKDPAPVSRAGEAAQSSAARVDREPANGARDCGHAICATDFFIDTTSPDCPVGSTCTMSVKVVATGNFHINDEYPYRFKADEAPGVTFLGTDAAGANTFTKAAGDWQKAEEKSGTMAVKFSAADRGTKTISGTLKLSVCSEQNCLLEQRPIKASVLLK